MERLINVTYSLNGQLHVEENRLTVSFT